MGIAERAIKHNDFETALEKWRNANDRWKKYWFETCEIIYNNNLVKWAKEYILDPVKKTIKKVSKKIETFLGTNIIINCNIDYPKGTELFYLIRLFDENKNLVYSKVGTTAKQTIPQRMRQHLNYYKDISFIVVDKVFDCGNLPAECFESYFRAYYIKKFPGTFQKNDRFKGVHFNLDEAEKLFNDWKVF